MKHSGALHAAIVLVLAVLACQSAANLPIPGGSASSGQVEAKGICAREPDLGFDVQRVSTMPTCSGDCTEIVPELGLAGAEALVAELTPQDTLCELGVSVETQAVIDRANGLAEQGDTEQALDLLAAHMAELGGTSGMGKPLAIPSRLSEGADQAVQDLYGMGQAAADMGGDDTPFTNAANSVFRDSASQELPTADLWETLEIEMEAGSLGDDEIADQAHEQRQERAEQEYREADAHVDPCTVTAEELKAKLKWAMTAAALDVSWTDYNRNPAFLTFLEDLVRASSVLKNREAGGKIEGCKVTGELEITYSMFFSVGTDEPVEVTTSVPFSLDLTEEPAGYQTAVELYTDEVFAFGDDTVHNVVDFDVDLNLWYTEGSTPLEVDLGIKGGSEFFVGVPIRSGTPDIDEFVQLEFPLTEGATQEFDLESLVDLKEWKVTLHLTPRS